MKNNMEIKKEDIDKMRIAIDSESVNIYIEFGLDSDIDPIHIAYWTIDEWAEDADVAVSIFKAIEWFYLDKKILLEILGFSLVD